MELSACIVVYNGCDEALKAAQTVLQYTRRHPLTLYLVDNASPDGSGARLEAAVKGGALSTQPGQKVEVRCLLDITEIRRDEIASVRRVDPRRMKWFFPVFGGCGFFGYYGHFLDLRRFERVKLYASEWKNFVEITDIYEDRLYVSCSDADRLVEELMPPGGNRPAEDDEEEEQAQ